jgi:phosphomevalonate kinase
MTTCISAPGKVLLAGGYLVLDRAYSGVVISTSSRFYTTVRPAGVDRVNRILVRSPQFESASWEYSTRVVDRVYKVVPEEYVCLLGPPLISLTGI